MTCMMYILYTCIVNIYTFTSGPVLLQVIDCTTVQCVYTCTCPTCTYKGAYYVHTCSPEYIILCTLDVVYIFLIVDQQDKIQPQT